MGINSSTKTKLIENLRYVIGLRRKQIVLLEQLLKWAEAFVNKISGGTDTLSEAEKISLRKVGFILFESPFDLDKMEKVEKELKEQNGDLRRGT
jgi:uncharacterized protein (DUF2344 family)